MSKIERQKVISNAILASTLIGASRLAQELENLDIDNPQEYAGAAIAIASIKELVNDVERIKDPLALGMQQYTIGIILGASLPDRDAALSVCKFLNAVLTKDDIPLETTEGYMRTLYDEGTNEWNHWAVDAFTE